MIALGVEPGAAADVLVARVERHVEGEDRAVTVRREEGLPARRVVLDDEGVRDAEAPPARQALLERLAEQRVDPLRQRDLGSGAAPT